jgi:hypothetical protein
LKAKAQKVCHQLGELKDKGYTKAWDKQMAEAFAARLAAVMADKARWDAVLGQAPESNAKAEIISESFSPLVAHIYDCWQNDRFADITSQAEIVNACKGTWQQPAPNVQNALSAPRTVAEALEKLGTVTKKKVRVCTGAKSTAESQVTIVAFPTILNELDDDVTPLERDRALKDWQEEWSNKSTAEWRESYEACRKAFEDRT